MLNYSFDSEDEKLFWHWLEELLVLDIIEVKPDKVTYDLNNSLDIKLIGKNLKEVSKPLIKVKHYTPDFIFKFKNNEYSYQLNSISIKRFKTPLITSEDGWCYVDVKGSYTRNLTSSITFPDRQVMLYQKHNIYVNKVICHNSKDTDTKGSCLFKTTFVPLNFIESSIRKKAGKNGEIAGETKIKYKIKNIDNFID